MQRHQTSPFGAMVAALLPKPPERDRRLTIGDAAVFYLRNRVMSAAQLAERLEMPVNRMRVEITMLRAAGRVVVAYRRTVHYDLTGPGRRDHVVRYYRAAEARRAEAQPCPTLAQVTGSASGLRPRGRPRLTCRNSTE